MKDFELIYGEVKCDRCWPLDHKKRLGYAINCGPNPWARGDEFYADAGFHTNGDDFYAELCFQCLSKLVAELAQRIATHLEE